jgi:hypothetical protein
LIAPLAYNAMPQLGSHFLADGQSTHEELAVAWAIVRLAHRTPASVENQASLEEARGRILDFASALGLDEEGLRDVLRERVDALVLGTHIRGGEPTPYDTSA